MHGKGLFSWPDGRKYNGEYRDDLKEGYGEFEWADGRKFEGGWKSGKQYGEGVYIDEGGRRKRGVWQEGNKVRWLVDGGGDGGVQDLVNKR